VASQNEHDVLAQKFEVAAQGMQQKAEEQKKLLEQYEQIQFYGWQSHNLKSRTIALIRKYEEAARSNMKEAAAHRQMAQPNPTYATPGVQIPQTGSN
jgi:alanyl-tRNA synthetase